MSGQIRKLDPTVTHAYTPEQCLRLAATMTEISILYYASGDYDKYAHYKKESTWFIDKAQELAEKEARDGKQHA